MTEPETSALTLRGQETRSRLGLTAGLAAVLLSLAGFVSWGYLTTIRAADTQARALAVAALFEQAQYNTAVQELYARQYRLQPSAAVHRRYQQAVEQTVQTLDSAESIGDPEARRHAKELLELERAYRVAADRMTSAVLHGDADAALIDGLEVAPAYFSLQDRVNETAQEYRTGAQRRVEELHRLQRRMLVGTIVGFAVGFVLLSMIWRTVLGYQQRLARHADLHAHLALHDPLTGLPNRTYFARRLTEELEVAAAVSGGDGGRVAGGDYGVAVMIADLDRFKEVNDTLGHHAGDQLLIEAGRRLRGALRRDDVVARLGGDEFALLAPAMRDPDSAVATAWAAARALREPFALDGAASPVAVSASIGLVFWTGTGSVDELVQRADAAMYRAKSGHLGVALYDELVDVEDPAPLATYGELRGLLEAEDPAGELVLHYQPQVRLDDGELYGVEALVRWQHPTLGLLPPGRFLPIAEQTGLDVALTGHLLTVAAADAAAWGRAGTPVTVSVNVAPPCLVYPGFGDVVRAALDRSGLPPTRLRIEVTEGSVMADPERSRGVLESLRDLGVSVSVDDFGSGYSSLGQLRRMPVHELKIDRPFVRELATNELDAVLVRTAIDLGHHHGTVVVAEGVEDVEALAVLRDLGCDVVQGYLLARPVPRAEIFDACDRARQVVRAALLAPTSV